MKENNGNSASAGLQFDEEMCERYIFGELSPADQDRFEETYFLDDAFFERYLAVKTELLDLLGRGELNSDKLSRMEPHFQATPPRRRRIEDTALFTRSVTAVAQRRDEKRIAVVAPPARNNGLIARFIRTITPFFGAPRLAAVAVLILAVIGGFYFLDRSSYFDDGSEMALVIDDISQPRAGQIAASPEPAVKEEASGDDPASRAGPTADRSIGDKGSAADTYPQIHVLRKTPLSMGQETTIASPSPNPPVNDRASTGFSLTLSTVGRDSGRDAAPSPPSGINIRDRRQPVSDPGEGLAQSVVLRPGATRGQGSANTLVLRSGNDQNWVNIILIYRAESYPKYLITVTDVQGTVVLKEDDLNEQKEEDGRRSISLWIDETSMFENRNRDYIAILQGQTSSGRLETIEEYYFHVRRIDKISPSSQAVLLADKPVKKEAAELSGKVMDPNGDPVPNAVVTVKNLMTGMTRNITSLDNGTYRIENLPPGKYEISTEAPSLKRNVIDSVDLTAANHIELPITLEGGVVVSVEGSDINPRPSITLQSMFSIGSVGVNRLELHGDSQVAQIQLVPPVTGHSSFNATIRTIAGKTVYSKNFRKSEVANGNINLSVSSKVLRTGDYVIQLRGRSGKGRFVPVAEFYFHVQKPD